MNLFLHGLEPRIVLGDTIYEVPSSERFDVVLTNPPSDTKGANQAPDRDDFTIATDAIGELESAVEELGAVLVLLENGNGANGTPAKRRTRP